MGSKPLFSSVFPSAQLDQLGTNLLETVDKRANLLAAAIRRAIPNPLREKALGAIGPQNMCGSSTSHCLGGKIDSVDAN
jgi:hypothetical protein